MNDQKKKFTWAILILLILTANTFLAQKQNPKIESAISGFFNGMSLLNTDTLKYYSTSDFQLLEDGQVWTMDSLIKKITTRQNPEIKRINKFEFIKAEVEESTAWVSYKNTADFSFGEQKQTSRWLESAVLVKQGGRWKIQMMHTTKLK